MILVKNNILGSIYIDASCSLSTTGVFMLTEQAVTELLGEMELDGFSLERKYGATWVFVKSKVKMLNPVLWNRPYTLTSFISKKSRGTIVIDVAIENENKELCSYSRVELCAIDVRNAKIRRTIEVGVDDTIEEHEEWMDLSFTKFPKLEYEKIEDIRIKYTNIDFLKHTNNKEYVKFILNTYTVDDLLCKPIKEMEMVYINQSVEGNILTISKTVNDALEYFIINRDADNIARCVVKR